MISAGASAFWLGILTAIGPCTITTGVLAVVYVARRLDRPVAVLGAAFWFAMGTVAGYAVLGLLIVGGSISMPESSRFLQKYTNEMLGPVLIIAGVVLLGLLPIKATGGMPTFAQRLADRADALGAFLLGIVFAATFCPVSAALFFGSLVPLAIRFRSPVLLPAVYGLGTAVPALVIAVALAFGFAGLGRAMRNIAVFELWARRLTGTAFVGVGIHLCLAYVFNLY